MNYEENDISFDLYGDGLGKVQLVQAMGSDATIVRSARVSFGRDKPSDDMNELSERDQKLINYLIKHSHTSTLEHNVVTLKFKVPLYVRSQHHRHRTWCLSGDTEVTFNRPSKWRKGFHSKQTGNKGQKFTLERLHKLWNNPVYHKRISNMLVRVWDEKEKIFTVSNLANVIFSGEKESYKVTLEDGKSIKTTADHKFLTKKGWLSLEEAVGLDLSNGGVATMSKDSYFLTNGTSNLSGIYKKVVAVEYIGTIPTYDLTIKGDNHNFVANGIVAHNCYNEVSRRYTSVDMEFYEPEEFRTQHKSNRQASNSDELINPLLGSVVDVTGMDESGVSANQAVKKHHVLSLELFNDLLGSGVSREQARGVLPQSLYTSYYGTVNLNNLFKFILLRMHEGAQWEIQKVAESCFKIASFLWPVVSKALAENVNSKEMSKRLSGLHQEAQKLRAKKVGF